MGKGVERGDGRAGGWEGEEGRGSGEGWVGMKGRDGTGREGRISPFEMKMLTTALAIIVRRLYVVHTASTPYPGLSGPEVMEFVEQGRRMKKPRHCTDEL